MAKKSITEDAQDVMRAAVLIELGARIQVLESEVNLSRDRMIRLYQEVKGVSPPKGMLPFSVDWFMTWSPNIHASLFYNIYLFLKDLAGCSRFEALTKGYKLYLEHCERHGSYVMLSFTRAWTLVRFFDAGILQLTRCCSCTGKFVTRKQDSAHSAVCGSCQPPSRAGKSAKAVPRITEDETVEECTVAESVAGEEFSSTLSSSVGVLPEQCEASCGQAA
ncbi:flagellar transcriptional regulator FlhC [Caballeronia mineralivorans]|jgi:flagellar transcriptional activator FlhC|uniref:flagellar transcriptional regulator FlhC n=1 Tax=Caballeronia mineralivorans TaxID=2010198 RepID=UPI0023F55797|nr:flagellar transcriptional regulator FlhC [Caballeronia mineralivorans]MDB5784468.1 Flagellar transcriptional regulator FlhC [Caballeronia mineralivorans]MEA3097015.1 flagellar transcriptional activator FlhC [Caballeronia mineralivorans]